MKALVSLVLASAALALGGPASAQFAKPEDAIKYRQSAMTIMSNHVGRIGAMVNGRVPFDAKAAAENADIVAEMSRLPWTAFGPGTDKGGQTRAKSDIWSEPAKFKEANDKLMSDAVKLVAAAKTGNLDNLKSAFGATAGNCKSCHDAFRTQ